MGVAQNSLLGALTTAAAGAAAVGKVTADIDKASVEKMNKADSLQEEFLQNKEAMNFNETQMKPLEKAANAGNSGPAHRLGFTDRQAAQEALNQLQEKQLALAELNERKAQQYARLTHKNIIGGTK